MDLIERIRQGLTTEEDARAVMRLDAALIKVMQLVRWRDVGLDTLEQAQAALEAVWHEDGRA